MYVYTLEIMMYTHINKMTHTIILELTICMLHTNELLLLCYTTLSEFSVLHCQTQQRSVFTKETSEATLYWVG